MTIVKPKKALGQHFLKDLSVARRIADSIDTCPHLPVLEIGPGMGVLTQFLMEKERPLKVVEIDRESVEYLQANFPKELSDNIIAGDFLKMNLKEYFGEEPFVLIGNYPYNISSQIFFKLLDYKDQIPCCSGMIQKEVAERIASPAGKKAYGILSVLLQTYYDIEYLFTVSEHVFDPPPKVKSRESALRCGAVQNGYQNLLQPKAQDPEKFSQTLAGQGGIHLPRAYFRQKTRATGCGAIHYPQPDGRTRTQATKSL